MTKQVSLETAEPKCDGSGHIVTQPPTEVRENGSVVVTPLVVVSHCPGCSACTPEKCGECNLPFCLSPDSSDDKCGEAVCHGHQPSPDDGAKTLTELIKARVEALSALEADLRSQSDSGRDIERFDAVESFLIASMEQVADAALGEVNQEKFDLTKDQQEQREGAIKVRSRLLRWMGKEYCATFPCPCGVSVAHTHPTGEMRVVNTAPEPTTHREEAERLMGVQYDMFTDVEPGSKTDREMKQLEADVAAALTAAEARGFERGVREAEKAVCAIVTEGDSTQEAAEEVREALRRAIKPLYRSLLNSPKDNLLSPANGARE